MQKTRYPEFRRLTRLHCSTLFRNSLTLALPIACPANGIEAQAEQAIKNLGEILKAAGSDFSKVVKTTCFLAHISDFAAFNAIYEKYFVSKPARSCFEVSALPKGALVEIEAVAVVE